MPPCAALCRCSRIPPGAPATVWQGIGNAAPDIHCRWAGSGNRGAPPISDHWLAKP